MFKRLLLFFALFTGSLISSYSGTLSAQEFASADPVPWSGHWWPAKNGGIGTGMGYRGHPAPLEKYLLLTTGKTAGPALNWYMKNYYDPNAESWWGLCPEYARSAVKETYPILPSVHDNIVFRVGDKKGLLAVCHDSRDGIIYATGNPVDFHFWLLDYIRDQKNAFAADLGPEDEVWYFPVYAYQMHSEREGLREDVTVTIFYAAHMGPDYMGTREMERGPYTYTLDLDAQGNIIGGRWTDRSVSYHPKTLSYPETYGPKNPYLTVSDVNTIRKIARERDDELELPGNAPARLLPGAYHLVLLNRDIYTIQGRAGDMVFLDIFRENGSIQDMRAVITDADDVVVWEHVFDKSDVPAGFQFPLVNPPYKFELTQDNYLTDPNIYSLTMEYKGENDCVIPYIPQNGPWSGFAVTNSSMEETAEIMLMTQDVNGGPLQTVLGPVALEPGEKHLSHFSALSVRKHEYAGTDGLKLISTQPVNLVNLFADEHGPMAGFCGAASAGNRIVIPDVYDNDLWDPQHMAGAVTNESAMDAETVWNFYSDQGDLVQSFSRNLFPHAKFQIKPGSAPFLRIPDGGWVDIFAPDAAVMLSGYQYISSRPNQQDILETSHALMVSDETLYVQHVTLPSGPWRTMLTLINSVPYKNRVVIHPLRAGGSVPPDKIMVFNPYEKRKIPLSSDFGSAFNRSVLKIAASAELCGYVSYEAGQGDAAFLPLLTDDDFKSELMMPHSAKNVERWWTGVGVCNPNVHSLTAFVLPYDHQGQPLMPVGADILLAPGAYEIFTINQMFPDMARNIAFLKIFPELQDADVIGGFYLYGNGVTQDLKARSQVTGGNM